MRHRLAVLLAAVLGTYAAVQPASAGRPESATACSSPALSGPSTAVVGELYTVDACGFAPGTLVAVEVTEAGGCCLALNAGTDGDGRFSYSGDVRGPGMYRLRASLPRRNGRYVVVAEWSFSVER